MAGTPRKPCALMSVLFIIYLSLLRPIDSYVVGEGSLTCSLGQEKVTRLHFFLQDFISTANPSAVRVAQVNGTRLPSLFGDLYVADDPMTEGVDVASKVVGNAQGIYALTGQDKFSIFMAMDFGFTAGEFNGSSISMVSRNPISEPNREMAVVGGRGRFRLARGFAQLTTRYFSGPDAIVEYNVTVFHY
ncbi:hypothetical protein Taro_046195 [Colocasia esculenta]|uniref:Dirigent protein n=1 Tax=Colocasia esculenta TaxID=4460 RepID=A0A843X768_COLES|nr:hypothetical protein [Colocasia esculenta]